MTSTSTKTSDKWVKCLAQGGHLLATAISATAIVEAAKTRHKIDGRELVALGEALIAGLLLASTCRKGERVSLSLKGDRYLKQAFVDAQPTGEVRGFLMVSPNASTSEIDSTLGPWQTGHLSVARLKQNEPEPYVGTVPMLTGHLAKDVTFYLLQSEQIPSAVGLAVNLDENSNVVAAGGFLVQVLPGATTKEIEVLEENIQKIQKLASEVSKDPNPISLLGKIFNDTAFTILDERELEFNCNCSRQRVTRALKLLGANELKDMISKDKGADINCDFCATNYRFESTDLEQIVESLVVK